MYLCLEIVWTPNLIFDRRTPKPTSPLLHTSMAIQPSRKYQMSTEFAEVQQRLYSHAAQILEAMKSPRAQGEREWIMLLTEEVVS
jgi:hypothetical protein